MFGGALARARTQAPSVACVSPSGVSPSVAAARVYSPSDSKEGREVERKEPTEECRASPVEGEKRRERGLEEGQEDGGNRERE